MPTKASVPVAVLCRVRVWGQHAAGCAFTSQDDLVDRERPGVGRAYPAPSRDRDGRARGAACHLAGGYRPHQGLRLSRDALVAALSVCAPRQMAELLRV